jgi:hypothetical protein
MSSMFFRPVTSDDQVLLMAPRRSTVSRETHRQDSLWPVPWRGLYASVATTCTIGTGSYSESKMLAWTIFTSWRKISLEISIRQLG